MNPGTLAPGQAVGSLRIGGRGWNGTLAGDGAVDGRDGVRPAVKGYSEVHVGQS
ncbi:hypothetical protein AB0I81_24230 [Nonomuraea sp. NPDC050404]|uniref:hypothetical protein n=1 Tax=Nonomuraea sp. NPDC050404 TaxID=3155783 RepID=UPI00340F2BC3